ncbi:hypothetical protein [Flavobacterium sp. Arc2]|uniref:hypothetical protein n=1 Tax=Flavobacterium sp. Arc2 TaxID=3046685 RepID=UPI00352CCC8E
MIPILNKQEKGKSRILLLKIERELKTVVFTMYPDKNIATSSFTGKIIMQNLNGEFINGYQVKDGFIITQFVKKSQSNGITKKDIIIDGVSFTNYDVVIVDNNYHNPRTSINYLSLFGGLAGIGSSSIDYGMGWDYGDGGGGGSTGGSTTTIDDKIDSKDLDPCSKEILEQIISGNSIESIINQFAGNDAQFTWTLVTNDGSTFKNSGNIAETNWNNATANSYLTEIDRSYTNTATRLSIARTIVHEAIHSYILSYIDIATQGGASASHKKFPELWNELVAKKYGDPNTTFGWNKYHHEEMSRNYVTTIANALAIWDNNQNNSQYYTDLAWGGLIETDIFNQTTALTAEDRVRIAESNKSEDLNNAYALSNPCN